MQTLLVLGGNEEMKTLHKLYTQKQGSIGLIIFLIIIQPLFCYGQTCEGDCENGFGKKMISLNIGYEGYWKNGKSHGKGRTLWFGELRYNGDWKDGLWHGYGIHYFNTAYSSDIGIYTASYEGNYLNGKRNGEGTSYYSNGDIQYVGHWKDNKKNGNGTIYYKDGGNYIGTFLNDEETGNGTSWDKNGQQVQLKAVKILKYSNGDKYVGETIGGRKNGKGLLTFHNGNKYIGLFDNGSISGYGVMYYSDGTRYIGEWKSDRYHGEGILSYRGGKSRFEGTFRYGNPLSGTTYYDNGSRRVGQWKNGEATHYYEGSSKYSKYIGEFKNFNHEGKGTLYFRDTSTSVIEKYVGDFASGEMDGNGTLFYKNGRRFEGEWHKDNKHGYGTYYYANGKSYSGNWENNVYQKPVTDSTQMNNTASTQYPKITSVKNSEIDSFIQKLMKIYALKQ